MATTTPTPIFPQNLLNVTVQLTNGSGTTVTSLYAGGSNGAKIESINVSTNDTVGHTIGIYIVNSGTNYLLTTGTIPGSSGALSGTASVDLMSNTWWPALRYDANGNKYLYIGTNYSLAVGLGTALTTGSTMNFFIQGGTF